MEVALTLSVHQLSVWKNASEMAQNQDPLNSPPYPSWEETPVGVS